ncbi:MAG TPA: hypothetical protein PKE26_05850 [Kiritimatiellia bacterium]|nr:hypothetical protein [Kiritimatiellia bacterium]HMP96355.1 hypothetical protein [Kiritimatiellia bacterium]
MVACLTGGWPTGEAAAQSAPAAPDRLFRQALKHYQDGDFQSGLDGFTAALAAMPAPPPFDPALLHYNRGIGLYRLTQPAEAASAFREALRTPDIRLQHRIYFNLGNALYQSAQLQLNEGDVAGAFRLYQESSTNYIQALRLEPGDQDAKINYELSMMAQIRILQMVAQAMERLRQGEQMIGEFRFVEAAQWFQQNQPMVEKALTLDPEVKKLFETMTERTTAVAEILVTPSGEATPP